MPVTFSSKNQPQMEPVDLTKRTDMSIEVRNLDQELADSSIIDSLTSQINVNDINTIVSFGAETANEIAKVSDSVLNSVDMQSLDKSNQMMTALSKIMNQFDLNEIQGETSFFGRFFHSARNQIDRVLAKYHTMGDEIDKIYVQLNVFKDEIGRSNQALQTMYEANVEQWKLLHAYIRAGEQGSAEIQTYLDQLSQQSESNSAVQLQIQQVQGAKDILEQRVLDLRTAESIAMQSIPMLSSMRISNANLLRKIDSAFIVTLPVFKQAVAQAILLKKQKLQADAMTELDKKTNEMLIKNAQNTSAQMQEITRLSSGSSVKAETLEKTWREILAGIDATKQIQEDARKERAADTEKLENIQREFVQRFGKQN